MEIKPVEHTVKSLLTGDFYRIPRFQRPYSWDRDNVTEFWQDAVATEDPDYFIGSFVVYRSSGAHEPLNVVDGQQRLTTITLLLAVVRDELNRLGEQEMGAGVQQLIERHDINNDLRFVLQTETSFPYLQEFIQKNSSAELHVPLGAEERDLKSAYDLLTEKVVEVLGDEEDADSAAAAASTATRRAASKKKLIAIRDKILGLQLIQIQLGNEEDASTLR